MRGLIWPAVVLLALGAATALKADEPQMLLRGSWAHLPSDAELAQCPLAEASTVRNATVALTCDIDDDGKLQNCHADERTPPNLAAYAICVSHYFEVRPGVHGQVWVPIGVEAR